MQDAPQRQFTRPGFTPGRTVRTALFLVLLTCLIWLGYTIFHVVALARGVNDSIKALRQDMSSLQNGDVKSSTAAMRADFAQTRRQMADLKAALLPFNGMLDNLGWVPVYGHDLETIPPVLESADALLRCASALDDAFGPLADRVTSGETGASSLNSILDAIDHNQAPLSEAHAELARAHAARARISGVDRLVPQISHPIQDMDTALKLLDDAMAGIDAAPTLLGDKQPNHILLLIQNSDELRATGGFITYSGYVVVNHGKITEMNFLDSKSPQIDQVDRYSYDVPPAPLYTYMNLPTWLFRDANWSPDFPSSAQKAADLYGQGLNVPVDTVVAVDQYTIPPYLEASGPFHLQDGSTVSAENFVALVQDLWSRSNPTNSQNSNKTFIGELGPLFLEQALKSKPGVLLQYGRITQRAIAHKDLLFYSRQPEIQNLAEVLKADGSISKAPGDYLYLVDSNVGYNKADLTVKRSLSYHVSLAEMPNLYSVLDVTYENPAPGLVQGSACTNGQQPVRQYADRADDCYADYLRVYLPEGTGMLSAPRSTIPTDYQWFHTDTSEPVVQIGPERGRDAFGGLIIVPARSTVGASFSYMPSPSAALSVDPHGQVIYRLTVQKQAGVRNVPIKITIDLPPGASLGEVSPAPTYADNGVVYYDTTLDSDVEIQVAIKVADAVVQKVRLLLPDQQATQATTPAPRLIPTGGPLETLIPDPTASVSPVTPLPNAATAITQVDLRLGPGVGYPAIGTVEAGEQVVMLRRNYAASWVLVQTGKGATGWLPASALQSSFDILDLVRTERLVETPTP